MSLEWSIDSLEQTGDPGDQVRAAVLRAILVDRGRDIPLPGAASSDLQVTVESLDGGTNSSGSMLLYSSEAAELTRPVSELVSHEEAHETLRDRVKVILKDYEMNFLGYVPRAEPISNRRLKKEADLVHPKKWEEEQKLDGRKYTHRFELGYLLRPGINRLHSMSIVTKEATDPLTRCEFYFTDDASSRRVQLIGQPNLFLPNSPHQETGGAQQSVALHRYMEGKSLREFIQSNVSPEGRHLGVTLDFKIEPKLSMRFISKRGIVEEISEFDYDGVQSLFKRTYIKGDYRPGDMGTLTEQAFIDLLKDVLDLVPQLRLEQS